MAPTFCYRCGDAVEEGCDPRDMVAVLDGLQKHLRLKRYDLKERSTDLTAPSSVNSLQTLHRPFSSSAFQILRIIHYHLTSKRPLYPFLPYLLEPFVVIGHCLVNAYPLDFAGTS
jgi:hypothetical protein